MPSNVFDLLAGAVRDGDSIRVTLTRSGGKLEALIVPALKKVNESDSNAERAALIGALARPWKVDAADGESIHQAIADSLHGSHDARESAKAALEELNTALSDAAARARTKATAAKSATAKSSGKPAGKVKADAKAAKKAPVKAKVTTSAPPAAAEDTAPPAPSAPVGPAAPSAPATSDAAAPPAPPAVEAAAGNTTPSLFE